MKSKNLPPIRYFLCLFVVSLALLCTEQVTAQRARAGNRAAKVQRSKANRGGSAQRNKPNVSNKRIYSSRDVNINVDNGHVNNSHNIRNTTVRRNGIHTYSRPPYVYGGRRFYSYHPYVYHPYRPFAWGPVWRPWGFIVATMATTAIIVSVNNAQYHYDQGLWYSPLNGGYVVCAAPVGGTVNALPAEAENITVNNVTNYYYGGSYYEKDEGRYKVVPPPAGAVVKHLPEGGEEVKVGDQTYVKIGDTYYQPVSGEKYEVVQIEKVENKKT